MSGQTEHAQPTCFDGGGSVGADERALLVDIDRHGVANASGVRRLLGAAAEPQRQGQALVELAGLCRARGRELDGLGALRLARRVAGTALPGIGARIAQARSAAPAPAPAEAGLRIVSYDADPAAFEALCGGGPICANFYHPGSPFGGLIGVDGERPIPEDDTIDNVSFHVCAGTRRLATVPLVIGRDAVASWVSWTRSGGGVPARVFFAEGGAGPARVLRAALDHLDHVVRAWGAREILLHEPLPQELALYKLLLGSGRHFSAELWDRPVVRLERTEAQLFADLRKSYKAGINWGRAHLRMRYVAGAAVDEAMERLVYDTLQRLHESVIRRFGDGMSRNLFLQPVAMCRSGHGEIAFAEAPDGTVCGLTVISDHGGIAHYSLGGSVPVGNRNPGHFVVFDAILRAKRRGQRCFHVNREFAAPISIVAQELKRKSRHDLDLIFFKRGFSDDLEIAYVYRVLPRAREEPGAAASVPGG